MMYGIFRSGSDQRTSQVVGENGAGSGDEAHLHLTDGEDMYVDKATGTLAWSFASTFKFKSLIIGLTVFNFIY